VLDRVGRLGARGRPESSEFSRTAVRPFHADRRSSIDPFLSDRRFCRAWMNWCMFGTIVNAPNAATYIVQASAAGLASHSMAMMPPAPALFITITVAFRSSPHD